MAETSRTPVRRPRNRKAQLADAAAELFRKHGYHQVSVNDIASAAGVTGPAVYRHFRGKQDILAHVLLTGMDTFGLVTERALATQGTPAEQLTALLRAVAALAVDRREITALWRWEGRHLAEADRTKIRHRGGELIAQWGIALRDVRPTLSLADAELLGWATLSVYGSVSVHHVSPPRRLEDFAVTKRRHSAADGRSAAPLQDDVPGRLHHQQHEVGRGTRHGARPGESSGRGRDHGAVRTCR